MKLSVCIPVYQTDVQLLTETIIEQCASESIDYEICLVDDDSAEEIRSQNRLLKHKFSTVSYHQLEENVGRAAIRNILAKRSAGDFCLFLDSDVQIKEDDFIKTYLQSIDGEHPQLVNGGCVYQMNKEQRKGKALRYKYGKFVEEISKDEEGTITSPFVGCNFLVSRAVFETIHFDEKLVNYGFEDFLFFVQFQEQFQDFSLIENPVVITDVDTNELYLSKTTEAMQNLAILYHQRQLLPKNNIRLLLVYEELKSKGLVGSFYKMSKNILPLLLINLTSSNPSLKLFQFFKLLTFIRNIRDLES